MRRTPAPSLVCLRFLPASLLPALAALLLLAGCSKQGEGERCNRDNGDLDCEAGLFCVGEDQISITGTGFALCCPLVEPTVDACRARSSFEPEPDAGLPPLPVPMTPMTPMTPLPDAGAVTPDAGNVQVTPDASVSAGDGGT